MANNVTVTTQLSTFALIRDILRTNSTIANRFPVTSFYEYEPMHKSAGFRGFPYIVIEIPRTVSESVVLNRAIDNKEFTINITMVNEWDARSNVVTYSNAIIDVLESDTTLKSSGYYDLDVNLIDSAVEPTDQKSVIVTTFEVTNTGMVSR